MSSPVVGHARIEYTADLARFARESDVAIRATVKNMVRQFEEGMTRINATAGAGGRAAGNTFNNSVVNNVRTVNTRIVNIIRDPAAYSRAANTNADAFTRTLRTRVEAAVRSLPDIKLNVYSTDMDREMVRIREKLQAVSKNIELGVDDKAALAEIDFLERELRALARNNPDIRVRANTRSALAEIEALKRSVDGFDRNNRLSRKFADMFDGIRNRLPILDTAATKLSGLADIAGKASPVVMPYLIVSAVSLIGPVAAGGTAVLLGLAGVAGVAGLAFVGIREQIAAGVGSGAKLQQEFTGISREIAAMGRLAADAVGPGLVTALHRVRAALPSFTPVIETIGHDLGGAASAFTDGLLTALGKARPLMTQLSGYVEDIAESFAHFTASQEFTDFLEYGAKMLPQIGSAVMSLSKGVISVAQSMSTLGENTLATIDGLGSVLALLGKIGSTKIPGTDKGGILDDLGLNSLGGLAGNAANPVGFLIKAGKSPLDNANDKQAQLLEQAKKKAYDEYMARQVDYSNASTGDAKALGVNNGVYQAATQAMKGTADQLAATTLNMRLQSDAAGLLKAALDGLSGKNLGVAQSLTSFQTGLLSLSDTFKTGAFDSTAFTESAVSQRAAIEGLVTAAQSHAEAVGTQTKSSAAATAALQADYAEIVKNTGATGAQKAAIEAYIQQIGAIPPVASTQVDVDTAEAKKNLEDLTGTTANPKATLDSIALDNALRVKNSDLDYFGGRKPAPTAGLSTSPFDAASGRANRALDQLGSKVATPTVAIHDLASAKIEELIGRLGAIDREIYVTVHERREQGLAPVQGRQADGRAIGGPVTAGTTYWVGEKGPELFTAPISGKIIPTGPSMQIKASLQQSAVTPQAARQFGYDLTKGGSTANTALAAGGAGAAVENTWHITQKPGEDAAELARRISAEQAWALSSGGYAMAGT